MVIYCCLSLISLHRHFFFVASISKINIPNINKKLKCKKYIFYSKSIRLCKELEKSTKEKISHRSKHALVNFKITKRIRVKTDRIELELQ